MPAEPLVRSSATGAIVRRLCYAALLVAALFLVGSTAAAAQEASDGAPESLVFFDSDAKLELGAEPVSVEIGSNAARAWTVSVSATLTAKGTSEQVPVPVSPSSVTIPVGGTVVVLVGPVQRAERSSTGFISVVAESDGQPLQVAHRPISSPPTVKPAVTKWSAVSVNFPYPIVRGDRSVPELPLAGPNCGTISIGTARLSSATDIASVRYECMASDFDADVTFNADDINSLDVGAYSGTLTLGSTDVGLSLTRTLHWTSPVLTILVGFLAASAQQAWVNNYRPLRRASNHLSAIAKRVAGGGLYGTGIQRLFEKNSTGEPYRRYNVTNAFLREVTRLQRNIDALQPGWAKRWFLSFIPWASREDLEEGLKSVTSDTAEMERLAAAWPELPTGLKMLAARLAEIKSHATLAPHLVARATEVVNPRASEPGQVEIEDIVTAKTLVAEVADTTIALGLLPAAAQLGELLDKVAPTVDTPVSDAPVFFAAQRKYRQALAELREAQSASTVKEAEVDRLLAEARSLALQLSVPEKGAVTKPQSAGVPADVGIQPSGAIATVLSAVVALFPRLSGPPSATGPSVRPVDTVWLVAAVALAAWTGLAALYVGKAWGSFADFAAMFAWAFGTTIVLAPVLAALQRVVAAPGTRPAEAEDGPRA